VFRNIDFNSESNLGKQKTQSPVESIFWRISTSRNSICGRPGSQKTWIGNTYSISSNVLPLMPGKKQASSTPSAQGVELLAKLDQPKKRGPHLRILPAVGGLLIEAAREVGSRDLPSSAWK